MSGILNAFSLQGRTALVTGGAGLYGRQIVRALAEAGARTYTASRNLEALETLAAENRQAGHDVRALRLDLGSDASIAETVDRVIGESGRIDVLVNNAVTRSACGGWNQPLEVFDESLHVNASALFSLTCRVGEDMRKHASGSIINIGSMMGMVGVEMDNYAGTEMGRNPSPIYFYEKGGMINFTRWAASILGSHNIRVNCVSPGGLWEARHPERFVRQYSARTQLGRMANDTDLMGILVFLASDASAYITGANIPVDGGYTAK